MLYWTAPPRSFVQFAKKLHDYNRAVARQAEERELKERLARVRKAKEANKKAEEEAKKFAGDATSDFHFGFGSGGNPSGGMGAMFNDPEIMEAMQDPEVMPAFLDIMNNPSNLMKYMGNPKVMKLIAKMKGQFYFVIFHIFLYFFCRFSGMPEMFSGNSDEKRQSGCPSECDKKECGQNAAAGEAPYHTQPTGKAPEPDLD
uniref:STI1 domain-containing protein n=1 Tax=Heterorhabditis bacteriophora TaxID=37862 RepID=A0A1I7XLT7_HETBA